MSKSTFNLLSFSGKMKTLHLSWMAFLLPLPFGLTSPHYC